MGIVQGILSLFQGYNWLIIPAALFCVVFHEVSHGYVALLLGDRTAKDQHRLTLNPIRHLDPIGLLCMILFKFGWAKPVPVNPYYFKNRKLGMSLVALAGPLSNIIFAVISLVLFRLVFLLHSNSAIITVIIDLFQNFFMILAFLNVALAVFNIIPIPPLDGSKILFAVLPNHMYGFILRYEQYGFLILFVLLNLSFFSLAINSVTNSVFGFLTNLILAGV